MLIEISFQFAVSPTRAVVDVEKLSTPLRFLMSGVASGSLYQGEPLPGAVAAPTVAAPLSDKYARFSAAAYKSNHSDFDSEKKSRASCPFNDFKDLTISAIGYPRENEIPHWSLTEGPKTGCCGNASGSFLTLAISQVSC